MMVYTWAVIIMGEGQDSWNWKGERRVMRRTITGIPNFVGHVL